MEEPVVLYSIQSYLAYYINTRFYGDKHFVWCAPFFDSHKQSGLTPKLPYTSNPIDIFKAFHKDITIRDNHYKRTEIQRNTIALIKGAKTMFKEGKIDEPALNSIITIIRQSIKDNNMQEYFRPLIFIIPYELNKPLIKRVNSKKAAGALSPEYLIKELPTNAFSIIDLGEEGIK